MSFYRDLNIKNKLTLGFSTVVFMTLAIGIFGYFQVDTMREADARLYQKGVLALDNVGDVSANFQRVRANIRESILESDPREIAYYEGRVGKFHEEIGTSAEALEKNLPDAQAKKLFDAFMETRKNYGRDLKNILELAKQNKDKEAFAYLKVNAYETEKELVAAIEELSNYLTRTAETIANRDAASATAAGRFMLGLAFGASLLAGIMSLLITRSIVTPLRLVLDAVGAQQEGGKEKARMVEAIAAGDLDQEIKAVEPMQLRPEWLSRDEAGVLLKAVAGMSEIQYKLDQAFARMTKALRNNRDAEALHNWLKGGQNELSTLLRGDKPLADLTGAALAFLTRYLGGGVGVFYVFDKAEGNLQRAASYALPSRGEKHERIAPGEGLAGQAARDRRMICENAAPPGYLPISSALGKADPLNIVALPLVHNDQLVGVLEIGSFKPFTENDIEFLNQSMEGLAISISVNRSRQLVNELLEQTQAQTEELQAQTEELRVQQEELQQSNEELEERAQTLEQQREQIRAKNLEVEKASRELQRKAGELERVSTYKSEFLANMSHELRTPLNSLMILSGLLRENKSGNLTDKQVEYAAMINSAGKDLLNLINDILDLSKIESGHLDFHNEELSLSEIAEQLQLVFKPVAEQKGLTFAMSSRDTAPLTIQTDRQRSLQILKNLLSNAFKFTSHGAITVEMYAPDRQENPLSAPAVAFVVRDTGIGIPDDKREIIFNAFQQADGTTSRRFGGTGLGLSISRQLARSMQGEITVSSAPGAGSAFTLYLPLSAGLTQKTDTAPVADVKPIAPAAPPRKNEVIVPIDVRPAAAPVPDDRQCVAPGERSILIIEDDQAFAGILRDMVRERGFAALVAVDGESGIALAEQFQPNAIILDVMLPHLDGWGVMRSLKDNLRTRHIPVHFITCLEDRQKAMTMGAIGFVTKPVSSGQLEEVFSSIEQAIAKTVKKLLIVEDNRDEARALTTLLSARDVVIATAVNGKEAMACLAREPIDCIVLDLGLGDMSAFELLDHIKGLAPAQRIPIIIHTGKELTRDEELRLRRYTESIILKGAKSPDRLLNEVALFLHLVESSLAPDKQRMIRAALDKEVMLENKKVLLVDDDMRNLFSLTSVLTEKDMVVIGAENGRDALVQLDKNPDMDIVLMDIMMPEMDGYETMRTIRKDPRFKALPIIALTAKAMKGDREACLIAGASDYITKPVDIEKLFSLLRVWLYSGS